MQSLQWGQGGKKQSQASQPAMKPCPPCPQHLPLKLVPSIFRYPPLFTPLPLVLFYMPDDSCIFGPFAFEEARKHYDFLMLKKRKEKKKNTFPPKMFCINLSIGSWFMSGPFSMKCPAWAVTPAKYNPLFLLIFCKGPLKVHILQSGDLIASSQILKSLVNF